MPVIVGSTIFRSILSNNASVAKGTGETELYNLAKDPFERRNLAKSKASRVKRLTKQLNALLPES